MESRPTEPDQEGMASAMRAKLTAMALDHLDGIDARTAVVLQGCGVLREGALGDTEDPVERLLATGIPADAPHGPYVFMRDPNDGTVGAIDLSHRVLDWRHEVRARALDLLLSHVIERGLACERTQRVFDENRANAASAIGPVWRAAALEIHDSLQSDWLCSVSAVRQSIAAGFTEGYRDHIRRVLRPTVEALGAVPVPERVAASGELLGVSEAQLRNEKDVARIMELYYAKYGRVPFAKQRSAASVVQGWLRHHAVESLWTAMWSWADAIDSPLPRYHVCQVFLALPHLVPPSERARLCEEVAEIVLGSTGATDTGKWRDAWRLRCDLARHFGTLIQVAGASDGEACSLLAWWMAEEVGRLVGNESSEIDKFRKSVVERELILSAIAREVQRPNLTASTLWYETQFGGSIWSRSLQSEGGKALASLMSAHASQGVGRLMTQALVRSILTGVTREDGVYACEPSVVSVAEVWATHFDEESDEYRSIKTCVSSMRELDEIKSADRLLCQLGMGNEMDDFLVASRLRRDAYSGVLSAIDLRESLDSSVVRERVFLRLNGGTLGMLLDAFGELQAHDEKWRFGLPHLYALAAIEASKDDERRTLLYGAAVLACIAAGSVSAIARLAKAPNPSAFVGNAQYWHDQLVEIAAAEPWQLAFQVKAVLCELSDAR